MNRSLTEGDYENALEVENIHRLLMQKIFVEIQKIIDDEKELSNIQKNFFLNQEENTDLQQSAQILSVFFDLFALKISKKLNDSKNGRPNSSEFIDYDEYHRLEEILQRHEADNRMYLRSQLQSRIDIDFLKVKVQELEKEKQLALNQIKTQFENEKEEMLTSLKEHLAQKHKEIAAMHSEITLLKKRNTELKKQSDSSQTALQNLQATLLDLQNFKNRCKHIHHYDSVQDLENGLLLQQQQQQLQGDKRDLISKTIDPLLSHSIGGAVKHSKSLRSEMKHASDSDLTKHSTAAAISNIVLNSSSCSSSNKANHVNLSSSISTLHTNTLQKSCTPTKQRSSSQDQNHNTTSSNIANNSVSYHSNSQNNTTNSKRITQSHHSILPTNSMLSASSRGNSSSNPNNISHSNKHNASSASAVTSIGAVPSQQQQQQHQQQQQQQQQHHHLSNAISYTTHYNSLLQPSSNYRSYELANDPLIIQQHSRQYSKELPSTKKQLIKSIKDSFNRSSQKDRMNSQNASINMDQNELISIFQNSSNYHQNSHSFIPATIAATTASSAAAAAAAKKRSKSQQSGKVRTITAAASSSSMVRATSNQSNSRNRSNNQSYSQNSASLDYSTLHNILSKDSYLDVNFTSNHPIQSNQIPFSHYSQLYFVTFQAAQSQPYSQSFQHQQSQQLHQNHSAKQNIAQSIQQQMISTLCSSQSNSIAVNNKTMSQNRSSYSNSIQKRSQTQAQHR